MNTPEKRRPVQSALLLRSRSGWEAADTGILLWRQNWPALLLFFGVPPALFTAVLLALPLPEVEKFAGLILWWLRPFFDRFALHVAAVRFFEPDSNFRRLFRGLGKTLRRGIAGDLLWRRFSPFRSARMPIIVLEGLKGQALKKRRAAMSQGSLYFGFPVTVICLALSSVLLYGEVAFIVAVFEFIQPGYFTGEFWEHLSGLSTLSVVLSWFNLLFVETLFVCMGFGLYINARVETEGWDIELLFRKCTEKAKKRAWEDGAKTAALLLALFLVPAAVRAQNTEGTPEPKSRERFEAPSLSQENAKSLNEVLASEDFGTEKPGWKIRLKKDIDFNPDWDLNWRDLKFPQAREIMGIVMRTILVLAAAFTLIWSARYFYRYRAAFMPKKAVLKSRELPGGGDDPVRLLERAEALHRNGAIREAWALCFRAFLAAFGCLRGTAVPPETTEYEALAIAGEQAGFSRFVAQWIVFAYGGTRPAAGDFEQALVDCRLLLSDGNRVAQ
jgi:hypothetical protein